MPSKTSQTKITATFDQAIAVFQPLLDNGLSAETASNLVGNALRHDGTTESICQGDTFYSVNYSKRKDEYTLRIRPMSPADYRMEAVKAMHARITDNETHQIRDEYDAPRIAAEIRKLATLGQSPKWHNAVESYARMIETNVDRLLWAYQQGSVYFAYEAF
jgi:hypothetical protein